MRRGLLATLLGALALAGSASAMTPGQYFAFFQQAKAGKVAAAGTPIALKITSANFTSVSDLTPASQYVDGWTGDLTLKTKVLTGSTADYVTGWAASTGPASCNLTLTDTSPGYTSAAAATTVNRTICATSWLRQTYANSTLPTEAANAGNGQIGLTFSDRVYSTDTVTATAKAGLYTGSKVSSSIPVTNSASATYPPPIGFWVTEPGVRIGTGGSINLEFAAIQKYAGGSSPVAAVVFTAYDGVHTPVSHTVSAQAASARQLSTSCTATNGSNVLTACGSTAGFIVNERITVPGVPGQPKILSIDSSTQMTLGVTTTCTPTVLGAEVCSATPGVGEALADGVFPGAGIGDAHLGTNPSTAVAPTGTCTATCTVAAITLSAPASGQWAVGEWLTNATCLPANDFILSLGTGTGGAGTYTLKAAPTSTCSGAGTITGSYIGANPNGATVTTVSISTTSTSATASSGTVTFKHNYQGSTGPVTVTFGDPNPVYPVTFTAGDLASFTKGPIWFRAQVYPRVGDVILDTLNGADGTGCDWFYKNVNAGVCNSSSAAWFGSNTAASAEKISPNLHNLWAYNDTDNSYSPIYIPIASTGTCTTSACISTSNTMAAAGCTTTCAASPFAMVTAIKAYNNNVGNRTTIHNDLNGAVFGYLAGTYSGFGGAISTSVTANEPGLIFTSAIASTTIPLGLGGGDVPSNVIFHNATAANINPGPWAHVNNVQVGDASQVFQGVDTTLTTAFPVSTIILEGDNIVPTASPGAIYRFGAWWLYNNLIDEHGIEGNVLVPLAVTGAPALVWANTIVAGTYTTHFGNWNVYAGGGNITWGLQPQPANSTGSQAYLPQPTSIFLGFNKFMGGFIANFISPTLEVADNNVALVNNIWECLNRSGLVPCVQVYADGTNLPINNVLRYYEDVVGQRTNFAYAEGIPQANSFVVTTSGGSLVGGAAGCGGAQCAYTIQIDYAKGLSAATTSTDGAGGAINYNTANSVGSISLALPCDPNYSFLIYLDNNAGLVSGQPSHLATVTGQTNTAGNNIAGCQTVVITGIGGAATPLSFANPTPANPAKGFVKGEFVERFSIDYQWNNKGDLYGPASGTVSPSGGRIGNWPARWHVADTGDVWVTGTTINTGIQPNSGLGEVVCWLCTYNPANSSTDVSWVTYTSDRSWESNGSTPSYPALNIGEGDYCPSSATHVGSQIPAGYAAEPFDIAGTARKNDGTGYAGAYEVGCQ